MYTLFYENRFADVMRTCYSRFDCDTVEELQKEYDRLRNMEREYQPNIYVVVKKGVGIIDHLNEMKNARSQLSV